jgi:hypothetical protein
MKISITLLFIVIISGCAARPPLPEAINSNSLEAGNSLVVGSLSRRNGMRSFSSWSIYFRDINGTTSKKIGGKADPAALFNRYDFDFSEKTYSGNLFAFLVPAGEYEIFNAEMGLNQGTTYKHWRSERDFSIKFQAQPGEITYIGEYAVEPLSHKSFFFGLPVTSSGVWLIDDKSTRDIELLKAKYPNLDWNSFNKSIPTEVNTPIFVLKSRINKGNSSNF